MKKAQGKPQNIQEKIVEGGLAKFKATLALNEQPLVMDPSKKVKDILPPGVNIVHFICWKI
jgi:translation elongation factor EF-Ts